MKKIATFDGKPLFEVSTELSVPVKFSNSASLMMHTEIATGKHKKKDFRLIQDIGNRGFRMEWGNDHLDFNTSDLVTAMMNKIQELQKGRKK